MPLPQQAEALKAEGNALYLAGDHNAAIEKYTAAIKIASENAVLFANRAACHLALKQYEQTRQDAQKATELDPRYAKGWGRLGLSKYKEAMDAYGQAIECINPASSLSDAEKKLKAQCKSRHTEMELCAETRHFRIPESDIKMPWVLAEEMSDDLPTESSGQIILNALKYFEVSKAIFKTLTILPNGLAHGQNGGLEAFSNAILTDDRSILVKGSENLFQDYNLYLQFQAAQFHAWLDVKRSREVIRLAKARLHQTQDWGSIRGALSCQARSWIILGYVGRPTGNARDELFLWYDRTCKLIELGRAEWPDVPREDRGTIFDNTILRGAQVLRMNTYMAAYNLKHLRASGKFTLDGLMALADEILTQLENTPPQKVEDMRATPYFYLAFYLYPKAAAWGMRGCVYFRKASLESEDAIIKDREWARKAGEAYLKSADLYPEDDENHCFMLRFAIQNYSAAKAQAREILPIIKRLRLAFPKMRRIWRNSASALQRTHLDLIVLIDVERQFTQALAAGEVTLDGPIELVAPPIPIR